MSSFIPTLLILASNATGQATVIDSDTTLDPARDYGPIVVKASNITIEGRGARIVGARSGDPRGFRGTGILAEGVSGVTLRGVVVQGFESGLRIRDASGWNVEDCDFSDNFHDPEFGWGEQGRRGGIVLERVTDSRFTRNRANRVWDACVMVESSGNRLERNDFSKTSNTGMKLWRSCKNEVIRNNLSYGLRINPGEVHARDSAGLLIEAGSDDNKFVGNDATHGGDGIFIRVLNGWTSRGNVFIENDASYANNNGFEAWSPHNSYIRNKANHCSYGFWLGASDHTRLEGNEASFNGLADGFHNSPHLPDNGHAGIVFMFGPSSHTEVVGNRCEGNNGAGIALIGDPAKFRAFHWTIDFNTLIGNRWGIYGRHADWIDLAGNRFDRNRLAEIDFDDTVTNVSRREGTGIAGDWPALRLAWPTRIRAGQRFSASVEPAPSGALYRWDLGDGRIAVEGPAIRHTYERPGFHRVGVTITLPGSRHSVPLGRDVFVVDDLPEIEGGASAWSFDDPTSEVAFHDDGETVLIGDRSVRAEARPYGGGRTGLIRSFDPPMSVGERSELVFWIRFRNENLNGWQGPNPLIKLLGPDGKMLALTPNSDRLNRPGETEARDGWTRFAVPIDGGEGWTTQGDRPGQVCSLSIGLDSWGGDPWVVWIDGLAIRP
ncbi:MAG: right-handed parallel beta-helix repeat-containing protein [Isosphaeraceae bacterium]